MPSSTVNICVLTLVLLSFQQICQSRPHRSERGLVKDYFTPDSLIFPSDKFEKGEDGKFYLKKSAHMSDSEVKYSSSEEGKNNVESSSERETATDKSDNVQSENIKSEPLKEEVIMVSDVVPTQAIVEETKVIEEVKGTPEIKSVVEEAAKEVKMESEKASFTPVDPKFEAQPKPDSKDEIPMKTALPPMEVEEKVDEKITIGQVPDLYSRLVPIPGTFRIPVLIPIRQVTYGAVKVMPIPPADVADRLPLPYEDDIIGEGAHESESEGVSEPITEEKEEGIYHSGNPLTSRLPLPALPLGTFLKDLKEADKQNSEKQSKVVDVLGRKFLMQSNVMKYPTEDNSHLYLRFLSVKPLEDPKPILPKEIESEDTSRKEMKELEEKKKEEESVAKEVMKKEKGVIESEMEKEKSMIESEMKKEEVVLKEPEVLKVEETKVKMNVEQEVPEEVIIRNMGGPEVKIEESEGKKFVEDAIDEMEIHSIEHSVAATELKPVQKTEEKFVTSVEKAKNEVVEMKVDTELKEKESVSVENEKELEKKIKEEETISEDTKKGVEAVDSLLKEENAKKEMEIANKKDFFLVEKKKKGKFLEESEKVKSSKKTDKKKKCKCEEKDSDSEDEDE